MADIRINSVEFESGQEPSDDYDDEFATSFDVSFTLGGRVVAALLGKQVRVLDRALLKVDGKQAVRAFQNNPRLQDEVLKAASRQIKQALFDYVDDEFGRGVRTTAMEFHTDSMYWTGSVDARKGTVTIEGQVSVEGEFTDSRMASVQRVARAWLRQKRAGEVGKTILQQMGGSRRLSAMIGAKDFLVGHKDRGALGGLSFKFARPARGKPNYIKILLMPSDTYTVEFGSVQGHSYKRHKIFEDIYADQLKSLFERQTGLYLSL